MEEELEEIAYQSIDLEGWYKVEVERGLRCFEVLLETEDAAERPSMGEMVDRILEHIDYPVYQATIDSYPEKNRYEAIIFNAHNPKRN